MAEKRRLPVIASSSGGSAESDDDEKRPPWQWVGFGVVAMFAAWLPLAAGASMISRRIAESTIGAGLDEAATQAKIASLDAAAQRNLVIAYLVPNLAAVTLAAAFAGYVIGRFGAGGKRSAGIAATIVCVLVTALAVRDLRALEALIVILVFAVLSAIGGAWGGARKRRRA